MPLASSPSSAAAPTERFSGFSSTSSAVHGSVCGFVAAQAAAAAGAEASGKWAGYLEVLLSAEVQDLIRAHLEGGADALTSGGARSSKKRKLEAGAAPAPPPAAAAAPADEVWWRVCFSDGTASSVAVPEGARVAVM
jgi:hypothetical protein